MIIEAIPLERLNPAKYNPRKDLKPGDSEYEKLKKSILEFDMVEPLVWNKRTGNLVGGHQRLKILKELGVKNVDVSVVDLSEVKEKALNLALNKIQGEWDYPMLKDLLEEIDTGDFDIEITGFDDKEIEDLMTQFHLSEEGLTDDDEIPEKVKTICKIGDLWQLGNHRLLCGDATKKEDVERLMNGEKVDMVFTDPPYGISLVKNGMVGADFGVAKKGKYEPVLGDGDIEIARKAFDVLATITDRMIIFGGNYFLDFLPASDGWLIWDKRGDSGIKNTFADGEMAWCSFHTPVRIYKQLWNGMIREGEHDKRVHPTQKPIRLLADIIKDFTNEDDVVLDLFGGSGSTLIACEQLNRKCFMMEIEPHYCDVIIQRWQNFTGKQAMKEE